MGIYQILSLFALLLFYTAYFVKMLLLRRRGIRVDLLGKGTKPTRVRVIEILLKVATYLGAVVQFATVLLPHRLMVSFTHPITQIVGIVLAYVGCAFFLLAIWTMKANWRAGFIEDQNTELVTVGVYRISRNPAFVGFDLLYIGIAQVYLGLPMILVCLSALVLFHYQILGEEIHMEEVFGKNYFIYKNLVHRYCGRKQVGL